MASKKPGTTSRSKTSGRSKPSARTGSQTRSKTGGKKAASGGTKTAGRKSTRTATVKKTKRTTAARSKTPPKKTGKKTRGKDTFLSRHRNYFLGLTLGLLVGVLGALALQYYPEVRRFIKAPSAGSAKNTNTTPRQAKTARPKPISNGVNTKTKKSPAPPSNHTVSKTDRPGGILYEEIHGLEHRIRKIDQVIYTSLYNLNVPDTGINIMEVEHRVQGNHRWDHAFIEVNLPENLTADQALADLKKVCGRLNPKARLDSSRINEGQAVRIHIDRLHTHTIHYLASLQSKPPKPVLPEPVKPETIPPPRGGKPKAAIVIDDFGLNLDQARCFQDLPFPVACSVLPYLSHSRDIARLARENNKMVMLHMPMQPVSWPQTDPGPGSLMVDMGRKEVQARVRQALNEVPYAQGVNNHMGSRFTEERIHMGWALGEVKRAKLFFVDSCTSVHSVGYSEARSLGIPTARRTIFLDNVQSAQAIKIQLRRLVAAAKKNGGAIGIGHVYPETCKVLKREYNWLKERVDIVPVNNLLH